MSIKDYYKQSPLRFILMIVNDILIYALLIVSTAVVMMEMTAIQQRNWRDFLLLTLACFGLILADYLLQGFNDYLVGKQNELYYVTLRQKITWHLYRDQLSHPVAQVQNRLTNDLVQNMENYLEAFMEIIGGVTVLVAVIILLLALHWSLLLTIMAMVAVSLLLPKLLEKPMQKATLRISESNRKYLDSLGKWLSGLAELRRYLAGEKLFSVASKAGRKLEDANVRQTAVMQELTVINGFVSTVFSTILFILAGYLIQQKLVVFGVIVAVDNCSLYLTMGIQLMIGAYSRIKGTKKLNQEIAASALPIVEVKGQNTGTPAAISTHNLSLQFPNGESLHFPDIDVQAGEKILLTGDSGAGKSTLLKLILGQIDASSGTVAFKDDQGNVVKPDMSRVGYIPQEPALFPASITDNVTMFMDELKQSVPALVEKAQLAGDITKFNQGLDEQIDLNKLNISGGQRQKIVLARALAHQSEIILIDEGTSAIDQKATMEILKIVTATPATVIFIAHSFNAQMTQLFDREIHLEKATK